MSPCLLLRCASAMLLASFLSTPGAGQTVEKLPAYLSTHRYAVTLNDTNAFSMLPQLMARRNVLISGEGASHDLLLYDTLQRALIRQLVRQNLRVALIEFGHDLGYLYSRYLAGDTGFSSRFVPAALFPYSPFVGKAAFRIAGIDFDRAGPFHLAVTNALNGIDTNGLRLTRNFARRILDTGYIRLDETHFNRFYKSVSAEFATLDSFARVELGDRYVTLKYLCTNPNTTKRYDYRDPAMAANFLREIQPFDTSGTYYCEIGNAHSKTDNRGSMAAILKKDPILEDRVIVMNTYCEGCRTSDGPTRDAHNRIGFLKGARLQAFREAALGQITLFDLSGLQGKDTELAEAGTLLLFVRDHD